ncbi:hypothetical protein [Paenibacillus glucanolyticus]|uniref:hypothetical protein n=1 Tax=Paenibacillus glucanolyticus TaxID=59843 RepID=UPI00128BE8F6|nr:hypothetical protein [Paenibacillus glucanolyticus]MPY19883.1 hypothetical protein [Paenibacillus glucanolyticus]
MKPFLDKHTLTKQQSLFLAKKKWDENIYCGMKMETGILRFLKPKRFYTGSMFPALRWTIYKPFSICGMLGVIW